MFFAVDDDRRDLLIEEDENHSKHSGHKGKRNQPPIRHIHGIDDPTSVSHSRQCVTSNSLVSEGPKLLHVTTDANANAKDRNPHKRTSWKLVGNPGCELVAN